MLLLLCIVLLLSISIHLFLRQKQFGKISSGKRLERIQASPNYRSGKFQNLSPTRDLTEGKTFFSVLIDYLLNKSKDVRPHTIIPTQKTDLHSLNPSENVLVWFGHSSYFIQIDGLKILVDPIFSGRSSPVKFTTKSYQGSDAYQTEDIPDIDYLFITHDHWDHLDFETVTKLKSKIKRVITGLGTGEHLEYWGYDPMIITECDWYEELALEEGFRVVAAPARHFSGRGLKRNQVLWSSFLLTTPCMKIFIGGDSGYDSHFSQVGAQYGPIDLAILECGQYNESWKYIHMMPEQVVQAAQDLKAKNLLPVHWAKFALAQHAWNEPITRVLEECRKKGMPVLHPMIGQKLDLQPMGTCKPWWNNL